MLDKIIRFSLKNRITVLVITGLLLIWGCFALLRTDVDIFPDLNAPTVVIMTEAPGLAADEVEKLVTYPIETAVNGATDVRRVRSSSATGFSVVTVEFGWDADPYRARQIVSEKLIPVAEQMPPGVGTPTIGPQSSILGEMMIIGLTADSTSLMSLRSIADRIIAPRLLALGGVSQATVIGGDVAEYQILLQPERMKYFNVSLDEVRDAVENLNSNASGGTLYDFGNEYIIKGSIHSNTTSDIGKSLVKSGPTGPVTIADIATVKIGAKQPRIGLASKNLTPAVLITVTKQHETSTIDLTKKIESTLADLAISLPSDIKISTDIFRQSDFIDESISNLQSSLLEGAIFVILVLFIFLMNFRTTLISVVALPLSIIVTVLILRLLGLTINTMSLGGIAIAIGSLVDDAIVDVENVYKRLRHNARCDRSNRLPVIKVVFEASREVRLPILNSSLIIIASFLPLFFLSGIEGRMLVPLGISFIVALIASTIVALTVTPILCSYLLKSSASAELKSQTDPWLARHLSAIYNKMLAGVLNHRKPVLITTGMLLVSALLLAPTLGRGFLPPFNEGSLTINVTSLPGISIDESDKIATEAEKFILSMPEINTVARKTGRAELDEHSRGVNSSEFEAPYTLNGRSRQEMVRELREKLSHIPGVTVEIGQPISHRIDAMLSGTEAQIAIKIFGDNLDKLNTYAHKVKGIISGVDGIVDVNVEQQTGSPQINIRPRREMMSRYGITNRQFATFVTTMLGGEAVSQVYEEGIPFDVTLRVNPDEIGGINGLADLMIDSNEGKIPLGTIADIVSTDGPNTINRENVNRRIVVSANIDGVDLRSAVNNIQDAISKNLKLPDGYYITYGGQFESEAEASRTLAFASAFALLIIFLLLYNEYRSLSKSLVILINMPLAVIGGILILVLTSSELNIPAIIGFISLMGIATRNGMLLMSRYNSLKDQGINLRDRIIQGSVDRLNPIIMTALTSSLALIPLAVRGGEPGNEIQAPMALVILGGLVTSTILNLFVVPALYYIINRKEIKK